MTLALLVVGMSSGARAGIVTPLPPNARVTDAGLTSLADAESPDLAELNGTLYATWLDDRQGGSQPDVYFAKSTDSGQTWSTNVRVSALPYDDWPDAPSIAVQPDGTLWVSWYLFYTNNSNKVNDVRLARSTDGGATWTRYTVVNGVDDDEDLWNPALAVDATRVYVLYHLRGAAGYEIRLKVIDAQTPTTTITTIVDDGTDSGRFTGGILDDGPSMALVQRNGTLCAAWEDRRSTFALYGACSTDQGQTFGPNRALSGANAVQPALALAPNGSLYAAYALDADAKRNILVRNSTDLGATWSAPITATQLDDSVRRAAGWDLAVDANGQLLLAWVRVYFGTNDIVLSTSVDGGLNFSSLTMEDGQGQYPTVSDPSEPTVVAVGSGISTRAHLVWTDDRNVQDQLWGTAVALDGTQPSAPPNARAAGEDNSNLIAWDAATDTSGIVGYRVFRAPLAGGPFAELSPLLVPTTFYRDVAAPAGVLFYRIVAVDGAGNSGPPSAVVQASVLAGTGTLIQGTLAFESGDTISLRTLADGATRIIGNAAGPIFATQGDMLYLVSNSTILTQAVAGGALNNFAGPFDSGIEFDVAGNNAAFATIGFRQFASVGAGGLCTVSEPRYFERAGQERYVDVDQLSSDVAVSADGRFIAYRDLGFCTTVATGIKQPPDLCIARTATGTKTCVSGLDAREPDFAPSGNGIVFAAPIGNGGVEIWKAQVQDDGSLIHYTQLTRGAANQPARMPAFSTDGNWIVFARDVDNGPAENFQLHAVRNDGFGVRALGIDGSNPVLRGGGSAPPASGLSKRALLPLLLR